MSENKRARGFTLVEILIAVVIIGLLAALMVPAYQMAMRTRVNSDTVGKIRSAAAVFDAYRSEVGSFPATAAAGAVPAAAVGFFDEFGIDWWGAPTPVGGQWHWQLSQYGAAAVISLVNVTASVAQMQDIDRMVDDGDLTSGYFRRDGAGNTYYFIVRP